MKKLITILVILTVLVGVLFATTENHQIKITVTIAETIPAFQLKIAGTTANSNSTGVAFGAAPSTKADNTAVAVTIDFESNSDADRKVVVDARIANDAKQSKIYTLTFSDGAFKTSGNNPVTVVSPSGITTSNASGTGYSTSGSNAVATVTFNGTDRCTADSLLTQATYQYPKADIAPGTYTADIKMQVVTN